MSEPRLICVTGADGAGKTTQVQRLAERLERGAQQKIAIVTIWDLLLDPSMHGKTAFTDPGQVDGYLSTLQPHARALFLFHCLHAALDLARAKQPDVCLLNAYWYKYYATEVAHGGDPAALQKLAAIFPEPEVTFCLQIEPQDAFTRKAVLSGYESGFPADKTEAAFLAFQAKAHAALADLAEGRGWVPLEGGRPQAELTATMLERIG